MQLLSIRGSADVVVFAIAYAAGAAGWAAFLIGVDVGPTISWVLLVRGPSTARITGWSPRSPRSVDLGPAP